MKTKANLSSKNSIPVRKVLKNMFYEAAKNRPIVFLAYFIQFSVSLITKFQIIVLPKFLIEELLAVNNGDEPSAHLQRIVFLVVLTLGIMFFGNILDGIANWIKNLSQEWFNEYFQVKNKHQSM